MILVCQNPSQWRRVKLLRLLIQLPETATFRLIIVQLFDSNTQREVNRLNQFLYQRLKKYW